MKERRQHERFNIPLPVRLETLESDRKEILEYETRDISTSGTFIPSLRSLPEGTRFIMDFTIPSDDIKEFKYVKSLKGSTGTLVRSNSKGMAVHFDRDCYIVSLSSNNMN
ncbi:MAG: PilZ domain-containing protein [Desulfobacterales bacterium]